MRNVVVAVLFAVVLTGCSSGASGSDLTTSSVSLTSTSVTTTTTVATTTTTTTVVTTTTTMVPAETTTTLDSRLIGERIPAAENLDHEMWAVYIFLWESWRSQEEYIASGARALWDETKAYAASLGYDPERMGWGDLACDPGGYTVLGFDPYDSPDYTAGALYFNAEADAAAVAEAFGPYTAGYGLVRIGCAD